MRVALDVSAVPVKVAGAGRYIVELARRLPDAGVTTTLVARRGDERWPVFAPDASVANVVPDNRIARLLYEATLAGTSEVARHVDVWHGPHYTMPRTGKTPTVVTIHDLTFFSNPEWHERAKVSFFRQAILTAARHADVLICVSETTRRLLEAVSPVHAPVVVAPHGVDLSRFTPDAADDATMLRELGIDPGRRAILFVGTLEPRKGLDVLMEAFAELSASDPDLELWVAGQAGWGGVDVAARERVRRLGYVSDGGLPALLRAASVVAYPSRGEGFGLPVLEALACGTPVVTTRGTVMEEVAGGAAALCEVGDASHLAATIATVLAESEATATRRRESGLARARAFTWEASVANHLAAYAMAAGASN